LIKESVRQRRWQETLHPNLDRSSPKRSWSGTRDQSWRTAENQNAHGIGFNVAFGENLDPDVEDCVIRYKHEKTSNVPGAVEARSLATHGPPRRVEPPDRRVGEVPDRRLSPDYHEREFLL